MPTKTWNQTDGNLASTDANWVGGVKPTTGDDVVFDGTSTAACTWDLALTLGAFNINAGYSGTVTQGANLTVTSFTIAAGNFTGANAYTLTDAGAFTKTGGTIGWPLNLELSGVSKAFTANATVKVRNLTVSGSYTLSIANSYLELGDPAVLTVSGSLEILANQGLQQYVSGCAASSINGSVTGAGTFRISYNNADSAIPAAYLAKIGTANIRIFLLSAGTGNRIFSLAGNQLISGNLQILSDHATYTLTLTHGSNYTLTVAGTVTLGVRAIMTQGTGLWSLGGLVQNGASSIFNQGANLNINGACAISAGQFVGDGTHPIYVWAGVSIVGAASVSGLFRAPINPNLITSMAARGSLD